MLHHFTTLKYPQKWKCRKCSFYVKLTKGLTTNWLDKPGLRLDQKKTKVVLSEIRYPKRLQEKSRVNFRKGFKPVKVGIVKVTRH